ncbi:hypothetical protein [Paraglaciecola sp. 2405UD69-4]|uniref:hypothetical protein n=1 Tax=Paraglaciecola sp. 2405UD69-4 TaxID=3391836 RepID=UPI0039C8EF2B
MTQTQKLYLKRLGYFLLLWALLQGVYSSAHYFQYQQEQRFYQLNIEKRIALDIGKLQLANPALSVVSDKPSVTIYIKQLNQYLENQSAPARLSRIQDVDVFVDSDFTLLNSELNPANQKITLGLALLPWHFLTTLNPVALLFAILLSVLAYKLQPKKTEEEKESLKASSAAVRPILSINLHNKTLCHREVNRNVKLSNKPFCFYVALLEYCVKEPEPYLSQSKDVPEDIIALANKYFYRLIELGHTKRKRPDFNTNLDKTLSEIRASLDMVFLHQTTDKKMFYPPKAQGEGSRSKLHNYALEHIAAENLEIIGK